MPKSDVSQNDTRYNGNIPDKTEEVSESPFEILLRQERIEIGKRRKNNEIGSPMPDGAEAADLTGLSLSGGGIRAACFSLGLLEGFDQSLSPRVYSGPRF